MSQNICQDLAYLKKISKKHLTDKLANITDVEASTIIKIINFIKPFVPGKENYNNIAYQIPFLLMANQVIRSAGYSKQAAKLTPLVSPCSLHALLIDTTSLYSMFCSSSANRRMEVYDYHANAIQPAATALENKDAVFSSFFNIERLIAVSSSHGLVFANRMHILPGLKAVRLYGTRKLNRRKPKQQKAKQEKTASSSTFASNEDTKVKLAILAAEKTALENLLKQQQKQQKEFLLNNSIHQLKERWKMDIDRKQERYLEVEIAKQKKRELTFGQLEIKRKLASVKQRIYEARNLSPSPPVSPSNKVIITNDKPCHHKVENCKLHSDLDICNLTFSGTDNGIVTVTETVAFDMHRLKYHLELYNRFNVLKDQGNLLYTSLYH
jgi:hypothetical protein